MGRVLKCMRLPMGGVQRMLFSLLPQQQRTFFVRWSLCPLQPTVLGGRRSLWKCPFQVVRPFLFMSEQRHSLRIFHIQQPLHQARLPYRPWSFPGCNSGEGGSMPWKRSSQLRVVLCHGSDYVLLLLLTVVEREVLEMKVMKHWVIKRWLASQK